ncbi:MAG: hypothetical protein ABSG25_07880, partial [Bryobacteraceae bacterium]
SSIFWVNINRQFKQQSTEWRPGTALHRRGLLTDELFPLFIMYISLIYRSFLKQVILDRKYEKYWLPLNTQYLKYKQTHGYYENMWMMTGQLIDAIEITYDKAQDRVCVGIPVNKYQKVKGLKKKIKLNDLAKWMEFGTAKMQGTMKGMPPRPLFRMVRQNISKNIHKYYSDFNSMLGQIAD